MLANYTYLRGVYLYGNHNTTSLHYIILLFINKKINLENFLWDEILLRQILNLSKKHTSFSRK